MTSARRSSGYSHRDNDMNANEARQRIAALAHLLDSSIRLPGGFRIGLDGLVGLIPGIGDFAGTAVSSYLVVLAARAGVPRSVQLLMIYNIVVEMVVGSVPLIGDLFDFVWKANERNLALFDAHMAAPELGRTRNRIKAGAPLVLLALLLAGAGVLAAAVISLVWRAIAGA